MDAYRASKAKALAERSSWIWILDDEQTLRQLWSQLGIRAERDPKTGLVVYTAGFIIVDGKGHIRYHVNPGDWSNVKAIADKVDKASRGLAERAEKLRLTLTLPLLLPFTPLLLLELTTQSFPKLPYRLP